MFLSFGDFLPETQITQCNYPPAIAVRGYSNSGRPFICLSVLLSWMGSYMEIFEARVLGENLSFWLKNHQF